MTDPNGLVSGTCPSWRGHHPPARRGVIRVAYKIYLCGGETDTETPDPDCPRSDLHTPCPPGYTNWHAWASTRYARGSTQSRCPGCGKYAIWSPER